MDRLIDRPRYLSRIRPFVGIPVIKILTGVRRSGKSTLLQMLSAEISQSHPDAVVVHLNLESEAGLSIRTPQNLLDALRHCGADSHSRSYIFLDEVQRLESWEDAINAIRVDWDCDLYLTGSNSTMLSSELATNLAGRYTEFSIRPLAFAEFAELYPNEADRHALFEDYVSVGGFPLLKYFNRSLAPSLQYLQSVVDTVVVRDVIEHRNIRDVDLFQRILRYCVGNIGRTFSAHSIVRYLKSEGRTVSVDTVLSYLDYCTQAFLIERVPRFDITGKTVLRADEKYYAVDHGIRSAMGFDNRTDIELVLENIVYSDLRSRGYDVHVGCRGNKEVDFVAVNGSSRLYIQVSYLIAPEQTRDREFGALEAIADNYPKLVLSMDPMTQSRNGIEHLNIVDFLLDEGAA